MQKVDASASSTVERVQAELSETFRSKVTPFGKGSYALLDFPNHSNVGDSAIWVGERKLFEEFSLPAPTLVGTHALEWSRLESQAEDSPIFLHGGGNFGDIWTPHQEFRLKLLARYPGRPIIQLPQSIHFSDERARDRTARAIAEHGNFTLLLRDQPSLDLARAHFDCEAVLCPDAAFMMGPQKRRRAPDLDLMFLMRTDKEMIDAGSIPEFEGTSAVVDWLDPEVGLYRSISRKVRLDTLLWPHPRRLRYSDRSLRYYDMLANHRVERGLELLSRARFLITDRLHAHILATLLDVPHVFLDNSYGKISRFAAAFGTVREGAWSENNIDSAVSRAREFLASDHARVGA